jgi:enoyl-[acyl-carrier protein] reductase II
MFDNLRERSDLEAGVALSGQVAGRIEAIVPVAQVIAETVREFHQTVESLAKSYLRS